jgi:hypothetical protein
MPDEEPNTMDVAVHEDGHDHMAEEKTSSEHPDGGPIGVPGIIGQGVSSAAELAKDEGASGTVAGTDTQPASSGQVLSPGTSTDGG